MTQPQEQGASAARTAGPSSNELQNAHAAGIRACNWRLLSQPVSAEILEKYLPAAAAALASPADSAEMTAGEAACKAFYGAEHPKGADFDLAHDRGRWDRAGAAALASAPATPPGVLKLAGQLVAEIDGLIETTDGIAGLHRNGNLATWEELLPEGQYERLPSLDMLREALAAASKAGSASPTPPGVPDSVRALSEDYARAAEERDRTEAAHNRLFALYIEEDPSVAPEDESAARRAYTDACLEKVAAGQRLIDGCLAFISAHPAGQSTGLGAALECTGCGSRESIESIRARGFMSCCPERKMQSAPDSTRTGLVGVAETVASLIITNPDKAQQAIKNPALWGWFCGQIAASGVGYDVGKAHLYALLDAIAARPAAPEAQGAERVRHVKRGTEYEVLGEAEAQVSVGQTVYANVPEGAYVFREVKDGDNLTVYRGSDGKLWCRFTDEFRDGRFEPAPSSGQGGR